MSSILLMKLFVLAICCGVVLSAATNVWRLALSLIDRSQRKSRIKV